MFAGALNVKYVRPTPHGVGGLKFFNAKLCARKLVSHPSRGGRIEITLRAAYELGRQSHPSRGGRIEIKSPALYGRLTSPTPHGVGGLK